MKRQRLRDRVTLQRRGKNPDGAGGFTEGWADVSTDIPCDIYHRSGSENVIAERIKGIEILEIKMRALSQVDTLTTDDRLVNNVSGELYNVKTALPDDTRKWLYLTVEKGSLQ